MNSRRLIAALGLAILFITPAWADIETARKMLEHGDADGAIAVLEPLANEGDLRAMTLLGDIYHQSTTGKANYSTAWTWYNRAAKAGDPQGEYQIARMLWNGEGVPRNEGAAVQHYTQAADNKHEQARLELGLIYRDGKRQISRSAVKALKYLEAAAKQGNIEAELALEEMFERGQAPREEMERFRAELAIRQMSEPDRIRTAIVKWINSINTEFDGAGLRVRPDVVVKKVGSMFEATVSDLVLTPNDNETIRVGTIQVQLTPIDAASGGSSDDYMTTRRYQVTATAPERIEMQRGLDVHFVTYDATALTGIWIPAAFTMPVLEFTARDLKVTDSTGQVLFSASQARANAALEETEPGLWSGPSGIELNDMAMGNSGEGVLTIGRFAAATMMAGLKLEPYGQMANQMQVEPAGFFGLLLDPDAGANVMSNMIDLATSSRFKISVEKIAFADETDAFNFALTELNVGVEAHLLARNNASLAVSYGYSGLEVPSDAPEAALIPSGADFALTVNQIPIDTLGQHLIGMLGEAMMEASRAGLETATPASQMAAGMGDMSARMLSALSGAGTKANLDVALESKTSNLDLSGQIAVHSDAMFGAVGNFDLTVDNLAAVIAMTEHDPQFAAYKDLVDAFAATAATETDSTADGPAKFAILIESDGSILINDQDAMAIVGDALMTPQEPAGEE